MVYKKLIIYTDGGARGNPGPAGIGVVIYSQSKAVMKKYSRYIGEQTNNQAEYQALLLGLTAAKALQVPRLECYLDSELIVRQMRGEYKVKNKNIQPLYTEAINLVKNFQQVIFKHVPREKNQEADKLVNEAIDNKIKD